MCESSAGQLVATCAFCAPPEECPPAFIIDGLPAIYSPDVDLSTADIVGIEIYRTRSETPLEFLGVENTCGTIVIWTRFRR